MPYRSAAQRGYMHIHHPEIAHEWDKKYGGKIRRKKVHKSDVDDVVKSVFGPHSSRPGGHTRGQHGKTALRVSPEERAGLAVLGAGTLGLGAAALAGGAFRPGTGIAGIGRGLKTTGEVTARAFGDNPVGAVAAGAGLLGTGAALHQGVLRYSRRKEKDLPFKRAEKHLRHLEGMEGASPELQDAVRAMRSNANKQTRFPRTVLDELEQSGYKYGYAGSGRYNRAYGPFPAEEPGIQEALWVRRKKDKDVAKSYNEVIEFTKGLMV